MILTWENETVILELRSKTKPGIQHALSHSSLIIALGGLIWVIIFNSQWRYRGHQLVSTPLMFKLIQFFASFMWPPPSNSWNTELSAISWSDCVYSHLCVNSLVISTVWNVLHLLCLFFPYSPYRMWCPLGALLGHPQSPCSFPLFPLALAVITLNDSSTGMHASSFVVCIL